MVTHDQSEALSISDRVVVMEAGRITQIDTPYRRVRASGDALHLALRRQGQHAARARVVARDGDAIRIDLGHDLAETGRTAQLPERERVIGVGDAVTLCIRPEKLRLCAAGQRPSAGHA